jgi:formamidopyrimidine-DNA glycosylase
MPELPEVEALAGFLRTHAVGRAIARVDIAQISVLKTFDPPVSALSGLVVDDVHRHGKFLDLEASGLHLVVHLARGGWLRWREQLPAQPARPGKGPLAARVALDDGSGFELTEHGTQKRLALYVVRAADEVPGVARLGPDPLDPAYSLERFTELLASDRGQVKGVLRDQSKIAGIGNAYSDEVLHVARLSPFRPTANLSADEVQRLYDAIRTTLLDAVARSRELPASDLKDAKRAGMRVHGRTGQPCPECGDPVREVSFADRALQYCATCQTGGKPLADRRMSRLLK